MRRITTTLLTLAAACALASVAHATVVPNGAAVITRVFDDCPVSILTVNNNFPALIEIDDQNVNPPFCAGFANLHTWRFSSDGGATPQQFLNGDTFEYSCTLRLTGIAGEGGLSLAPWWSPNPDGLFNVRSTDGEIAVFGGRLPFFTFTGAFGLHYVAGTDIQLGISYFPNGLSPGDPAKVVYNLRYNAVNYTSGLLSFDEGNAAEGHGTWGALTPWYAGGHMKMFVQTIGQPHGINGKWSAIQYTAGPTPSKKSSWSEVKKLYR